MFCITEPENGAPYAVISPAGKAPISDIPEDVFIGLYKKHGALLLKGFNLDFGEFQAFTRRYCTSSVYNESRGRVIMDDAHNVQSVNLGYKPFPLHPELSREPWKPDVCFFWCLNPPSSGGETTICDGVEIVKMLPGEVFEKYKNRRLQYAHIAHPTVVEYWLGSPEPSDEMLAAPPKRCPYSLTRMPGGQIKRYFTRPLFHKPMFCEQLAFGNFILFARYMLGRKQNPVFENGEIIPDEFVAIIKEVSDKLTAPIPWQANDVVVLDNTRFMHGRNAIKNMDERKIASYFGYLNFAEPDEEEAKDPFWRHEEFRPPVLLTR